MKMLDYGDQIDVHRVNENFKVCHFFKFKDVKGCCLTHLLL